LTETDKTKRILQGHVTSDLACSTVIGKIVIWSKLLQSKSLGAKGVCPTSLTLSLSLHCKNGNLGQ